MRVPFVTGRELIYQHASTIHHRKGANISMRVPFVTGMGANIGIQVPFVTGRELLSSYEYHITGRKQISACEYHSSQEGS